MVTTHILVKVKLQHQLVQKTRVETNARTNTTDRITFLVRNPTTDTAYSLTGR